MKRNPSRALAIAAGLVIVALTAAAFWLSYAHLAEVALGHGLQQAPERAWAWPATLDLFIVAGELLMLRAALLGRVDWWAIGLTVVGSGGSIALNVAGVGGSAEPLDYVVAAVPPTAALLAFGALMRQIHQALAGHDEPSDVDVIHISSAPEAAVERVPAATPVPPAPEGYPAIEVRVPAVPEAVPPGVRLLPLVARPESAPVVPETVVEAPVPEPVPDVEVPVPAAQVHPDWWKVPGDYADKNGNPTDPDDDIPDPDPLVVQARADFPSEVPGVRRLKETYGIGQPRAQRIRDELMGVHS